MDRIEFPTEYLLVNPNTLERFHLLSRVFLPLFWLRAFLLLCSLMHVNEFNWIISCHFVGLLSPRLVWHVKIFISARKNAAM